MRGRILQRVANDDGVAMLIAVLFLAVAIALGTAVAGVAIAGDKSANRDRQATGAQQTSEGGVAQAIQVIRSEPASYFNCPDPVPSPLPAGDCSNTWTNPNAPEKVSANGTVGSCVTGVACYAVWIGTLQGMVLPTSANPNPTAYYRIHSVGYYGGGPGARALTVDVSAKLDHFPVGLYADGFTSNGTPNVYHESLFSLGCIINRVPDGSGGGGISFALSNGQPTTDYYYDQPAAAHSAQLVTTANHSCTTSNGSGGPIHANGVCNTTYPYDQDSAGGALTSGDGCYEKWTDTATGKTYPTNVASAGAGAGSSFTTNDLYNVGYRPKGLSSSEYSALAQIAQSEGTYFTPSSACWPNCSPSTALTNDGSPPNAVVYYDNANGATIKLGPGDFPSAYFRAPSSSNCSLASVVLVIRQGNLVFNSSGSGSSTVGLVASMFIPEGSYDSKGNLMVIGTLFAQTINLEGGQTFQLDQCFANNPPGELTNVRVVRYHGIDTSNVQ